MRLARLLGVILVAGVISVLVALGRNQGPRPLRVCTWSGYFPDSAVSGFSHTSGIPVEISYFSSNEELLAKLRLGASGYDIILPSDYMVERMRHLELLQPLDASKLTNLHHLDEYYSNQPYDPGLHYSVPFVQGITGIAINTRRVKLPEREISWDILFHSPRPKHTSLLDDMREVFAAVLKTQGRPPNSSTQEDLATAKAAIQQIKPRVALFTSEPLPLLLKGELEIAHIFSTQAVQAALVDPAIKFFIPKEGSTVWTDNLSIPRSSDRTEDAHAFINYFLDPEHALALVMENHLQTPNKTARLHLPATERDNPDVYPSRATLARLFFLGDIGDAMTLMGRLWTEVKS